MNITEDHLEQLCLDWFRANGFVAHAPICTGELSAGEHDHQIGVNP